MGRGTPKQAATDLYHQRPIWQAQARASLDAAVATAHGRSEWTAAMPDDEILRRLLVLNLACSATGT